MVPEESEKVNENQLPTKVSHAKGGISNDPLGTMTSKEIAELTGKQHGHVIRDINDLADVGAIHLSKTGEIFSKKDLLKSEQIYLQDSYGRNQPAYRLTKRDTLVLTSGYSAPQRAAIIDRWLELESNVVAIDEEQIAENYLAKIKEAKRLAIENKNLLLKNDQLYIESQTQKQALDYQQPFVEHSQALRESKSLIATTQLAATQGIEVSAIKLNKFLEKEGVLRKVNNTLVLTAHFLNNGYGKMVAYKYTDSKGEQCTAEQLRWYEEGRAFVLALWKKRKLEGLV